MEVFVRHLLKYLLWTVVAVVSLVGMLVAEVWDLFYGEDREGDDWGFHDMP